MSTYWWLERRSYLAFILRELSSIFVAWFVYSSCCWSTRSGAATRLPRVPGLGREPRLVVLNGITFAFVLFHAITWFNLAPKAMVVHLGGKRVPGALIAGANYAAWVVVTAFVLWLRRGDDGPKPIEPLLWMLFSAGGVVAALFVPALLFLFGVAFPLGWLSSPSHAHLVAVVGHPLARVLLFVLCTLSLFHGAHRFRYTLYDGLQIKHLNELIDLLCYGGAIVGSVAAGVLLWRFG